MGEVYWGEMDVDAWREMEAEAVAVEVEVEVMVVIRAVVRLGRERRRRGKWVRRMVGYSCDDTWR